jgi:hypothetical protein
MCHATHTSERETLSTSLTVSLVSI